MAIEKHMLQTHSLFEKAADVFEGVAELKKRLSSIQSDKMQLEDDNALLRRNNAELKAENRKLKRALYRACANWACAKMRYEQFDSNVFMCGFATDKEISWKSMMDKCRAKAEEFK